MTAISFGVDSFGRVKNVGGTAIVTKFAMISALPVWPLQSYYRIGQDVVEHEGVPFLFHSQSVEVQGIPLARIDRLSVAMAYIRGIAGGLTVMGSLVMVPGIMWLTGERLDRFAVVMTEALLIMLAVGVLLGLSSYAWPFRISQRERSIRELCGLALGHCVDPALITAEHANYIMEFAASAMLLKQLEESGISARDAEKCTALVCARAAIGRGEEAELCEMRTDELLARLGGVQNVK